MRPEIDIRLGDRKQLDWAQKWVTKHHYLHQPVDPRARPMVYLAWMGCKIVGLVMIGIPHATKCRAWWGYDGLPTQWQVVDLCRILAAPEVQSGGEFCKPEFVPGFVDRKGVFRSIFASWMMSEVLKRVQHDRVSMWPPVYLERPYHIELAISYHDPAFHKGTIYKLMGWQPMYTALDENNKAYPVPGPSGKYGWCWPLREPSWEWQDIKILQPRTMRLF